MCRGGNFLSHAESLHLEVLTTQLLSLSPSFAPYFRGLPGKLWVSHDSTNKIEGAEVRGVWGPWKAWSVGYQSVRKISLKPYHSNLQSVCSRSWITEPTTMQILNHRLIRPRLHKFVISITVNWTSKIFLKINHASFVRLDLQHLGSICRICLVGSVDCFFRIASSRALPDRFPPALHSCLVYPLAWCFSGR